MIIDAAASVCLSSNTAINSEFIRNFFLPVTEAYIC